MHRIYARQVTHYDINGEVIADGVFYAVSAEESEEKVPDWAFCWDLENAEKALAEINKAS